MGNIKNDSLGDRMKGFYEERAKTFLIRRTPVIIRIDGCHFHTFTKGFEKPFDNIMIQSMQLTMKTLCEKIQGCVLGYTQSDEITLVLIDYKTFGSSAWFDNEVQKICSVAASIATMAFNKAFARLVSEYINEHQENEKIIKAYEKSLNEGATFDARCFNIPKEEVTNCVFWRQLDAMRNSVSSLAQCHYTAKALHCINTPTMKRMLLENQKIDWDKMPIYIQRGSACIKTEDNGWVIDMEMPLLRGVDRKYLDNILTEYETSDITTDGQHKNDDNSVN